MPNLFKYFIPNVLLLVFLIAINVGCRKSELPTSVTDSIAKPFVATVVKTPADIVSARVEASHNTGKITGDIECTINANDEIIAVLPNVNAADKKLVLTFELRNSGSIAKINDVIQVSGTTLNDFTKPLTYNITAPDGTTKTYKVLVKVFTGLPILYITSSGPIVSKETYVKGSVVINPNLSFDQAQTSLTMQIRGRGNSTWTEFPKKPYRIKLDSKSPMLGMPTAKNWILLSNYADKTLMRNRLALMLGRRLKADFTADSRYVEVFLNGDYIGNYLLTAQVEVNESRVNIPELKPTNVSESEITGGYLMELDSKLDADYWFKTKKGIPLCIKSPEEPTAAQLNYIKTYIQTTEDVLFSDSWNDPVNGYAKYLNPDSFINWYFTEEIFQNNDSRDFSSVFYYKDRNGRLGMGPVWDFDTSAGNINYTNAKNPTGMWFIRDAPWMFRLVQDVNFNLKVRKRWAEIKDKEVRQIFSDIDETAAYLKLSQKKNFEKWPILGTYVWPNAYVFNDYDKEVAYLKSFLTQRVNWMNANMTNF